MLIAISLFLPWFHLNVVTDNPDFQRIEYDVNYFLKTTVTNAKQGDITIPTAIQSYDDLKSTYNGDVSKFYESFDYTNILILFIFSISLVFLIIIQLFTYKIDIKFLSDYRVFTIVSFLIFSISIVIIVFFAVFTNNSVNDSAVGNIAVNSSGSQINNIGFWSNVNLEKESVNISTMPGAGWFLFIIISVLSFLSSVSYLKKYDKIKKKG